MKQQLTEHFYLQEFLVSEEYPDLAKLISFSSIEFERVRFFCAAVLEPLRRKLGKPIEISSGKRSVELNLALEGHPSSHHLFNGYDGACHISVPGIEPMAVAKELVQLVQVQHLIVHPDYLHISFPDSSGVYNKIWQRFE